MRSSTRITALVVGSAMLIGVGCNENANLFSDSFRNLTSGNVVPLTPGAPSSLVLVRLINDTPDAIEFTVTAESQFVVFDDQNNPLLETSLETVRLRTFPAESVNENGALFDCPITRIGLGENIDLITDPNGLSVLEGFSVGDGEFDAGVGAGVGVPPMIPPLDSRAGNFGCGDTVIFRAIESQGSVQNIKVQSFVLPWTSQPTEFSGSHTFNNVRNFIESQRDEDG
ncbi:MAG: hypothetical protein GY778_18810 [bacterium]|nr:hypothetical protein [bacterium]